MQDITREKSPIKERILQYLEYKGISEYAFYKESGVSRSTLKQGTGISEDNIAKFISYALDISPAWLIIGEGEMLKKDIIFDEHEQKSDYFLEKKSTEKDHPKRPPKKTTQKEEKTTQKDHPKEIAHQLEYISNCEPYQPNESEISEEYDTVPMVDVCVAAGGGSVNSDYLDIKNKMKFPKGYLGRGEHLCVYVDGDSMWPTIVDNSMIVVRLLGREEWVDIKDNNIYVITTREGESYVKRLKNRLRHRGCVICHSDNFGGDYKDFKVCAEDINNIWEMKYCISDNPATPEEILNVHRWTAEAQLEKFKETILCQSLDSTEELL